MGTAVVDSKLGTVLNMAHEKHERLASIEEEDGEHAVTLRPAVPYSAGLSTVGAPMSDSDNRHNLLKQFPCISARSGGDAVMQDARLAASLAFTTVGENATAFESFRYSGGSDVMDKVVAELIPPPPVDGAVGDGSFHAVINGQMGRTYRTVWKRIKITSYTSLVYARALRTSFFRARSSTLTRLRTLHLGILRSPEP